MNHIVVEGLKWVGASVAAIASLAMFSMAPPNDDLYPTPYPTDPSFLELREPRDPRRRFKHKREPRIRYVESNEEPEDWAEERRSFHAHMLAQHGIKVRDYAFENKLPPVPKLSLKRKEKRRGPQPLKRTRDMLEPEAEAAAGPSSQGVSSSQGSRKAKRPRLERRPTEPDPQSQGMPPSSSFSGLGGFQEGPSSQGPCDPTPPSTPVIGSLNVILTPPMTPSSAGASSSQAQGASMSEPWIATPPPTPNGARAAVNGAVSPGIKHEFVEVAMDVDEPLAGQTSPTGLTREQTPVLPMAAHILSRSSSLSCSSLTSLSSTPSLSAGQHDGGTSNLIVRGRRPSLRDISSAYNVSPQASADTGQHAPRDRATKEKPASRSATPSKRQAGGDRKTRSSTAKQVAGSPKAVSGAVRRSPRTMKGKQPARR